MRRARPPRPSKRDGIWYLIRRVPQEFSDLDRRGIVRISTGIAVVDDPRARRAGEIVAELSKELEAYWQGMRDGRAAEARLRFDAAQKRARGLGVPYRTAEELSSGTAEEILSRLDLLVERKAVESDADVGTVLGGEGRPSLLLSELFTEYEAHQEARLNLMSENQRRKWRNPKKRALKNLMRVIGDKPLKEVSRVDAIEFRRWWLERLRDEELDIGTANKDIGHVSKMYRTVNVANQLGLSAVFAELRIEGEVEKQRMAFAPDFVRDEILAPGVLDALNDEAADIVRLIAETGMRLSEAASLRPETIHIQHEVPHVEVRPVGRVLKTAHSARAIPLVGVALEVMTRRANGFPRYLDKADSLSALVNKYLDLRGLLPTPDHSLYSLRHTFEDRLTAVEAPEKVVASLMGHKWSRPRYGLGPSLEQKQRWLETIAFTFPKHS